MTSICAHDNSTLENIKDSNFDKPSLTASSKNFSQLQDIINSGNSTINLDSDFKYVSGDSVSSNGIIIDRTLTINGNGHTIDGSDLVRIFSVSASNVVLKNINFTNAKANNGAAIYVSGRNLTVENSTFVNNYATGSGAAIYSRADNTNIINCNISNNKAYGPMVYSYGSYLNVVNSFFKKNYNINSYNNPMSRTGGAINAYGSRANIENSVFIDNDANTYAGAIMMIGSSSTINNCTFYDNSAQVMAGAVCAYGTSSKVLNSKFIDNHVYMGQNGGALYIYGANSLVSNTSFEKNSAQYMGGAVYCIQNNVVLDNLTCIDNYAGSGGAIYLSGSDYTSDSQNSNNKLKNSLFINNTARYGGGAVDALSHALIINSTFIGNDAGSYGGAVGLSNSNIYESKFLNNSAGFGGAVYGYNADIVNSTFDNNSAHYANSIYGFNTINIVNSSILDGDYINGGNKSKDFILSPHTQEDLMISSEGYYAYCAERYNGNPYVGLIDNRLILLKNIKNNQPVGEYLKILIYNYVSSRGDLISGFNNYVWEFTDGEYWNSQTAVIQEVIRLYNSGFRVPTEYSSKVLSNGTLMYFNFSSLISPSGQQNLFMFKFSYGDLVNETLDKEALNKTAIVGDNIEFRIVVSNMGTTPIYDIFVEDRDYSNGLVYQTWKSEVGNWTYDNLTQHWRLQSLDAGKSASIILFFKVLVNGTLYNNATSGVGDKNLTVSGNSTRVYNPNFTVEKIALTPEVNYLNQTQFQIIVKNTGDVNLTDVFVVEESYYGLIYDSWNENHLWTHSIVNGKHTWKFNNVLPVGAVTAFIVVFNTTDYGNFTNVIVAGSNQTDNKTGNNTTKVLKPDFIVVKNVLTPYVMLGNQTIFQIVVKNTGEVPLDDIVVIEEKYDGLIFNNSIIGDEWQYSFVNGKHTWKLIDILQPGFEEFFFVIFNTTRIGNFTNYVVAMSNKTDNKTGNNTTVVNETIPKGNYSNFTVKKIAIHQTVFVGNLVEFQIIVKNTGNTTLNNLTIYEKKYDGLVYHSYRDHFNFWIFNETEMSWRLNSTFFPGEELGIHVFFNTTRVGKFNNYVVVSSNETENKTDDENITVLKPGINIDKVVLNRTVIRGQQVMFEIIIRNTGQETLSDIVVRELKYDGLIFDHFIDPIGYWIKNENLSWSLNKTLYPNEYEGFLVVFNTTKRGNFTNFVEVSTNNTDNDTANDTVEVLDYNLVVNKITITNNAKIGDSVIFEIIVKNTGDLSIDNLFVLESKYDSGLVYLGFKPISGNWKHSLNSELKHMFTLDESLKVGKSASFRVIFKATKAGNFSNTVEAGFNNVTLVNSTNTTQIIDDAKNNKTQKNKTHQSNKTNNNSADIKKRYSFDKNATGNPLIVLILILAVIPFVRFKK